MEVPEPRKYPLPTRAVGLATSTTLPGERRLTNEVPGASRSGLASPSQVGPRPDHSAAAVPVASSPPAVSRTGSVPGEVTLPGAGPSLPAGTTTVIPLRH